MPEIRNLEQNGLRRSTRIRNAPDRWQFYTKIPMIKSIFSFNLYPLENPTFPSISSYFQRSINHLIHVNTLLDNTINNLTPFSFMSQTDNETYTYGEMLKQDDRSDFIQAMLVEVNDHFSRETVEKVPRSRAGNNKLIQLVWSFKRKRNPNGDLLKHKARLCAHGGMTQWGVNYWETYSPVVNWMSV